MYVLNEKRKNAYGVLKISGHPPEREEKMFTFSGHHKETAHGEEHPESGQVKSLFCNFGLLWL